MMTTIQSIRRNGAIHTALQTLRGSISLSAFILVTVGAFIPFVPIALLKLFAPTRRTRRWFVSLLLGIAECWSHTLIWVAQLIAGSRIQVNGLGRTHLGGKYLLLCNHQGWLDIPVLAQALHGHLRFPRFFIKRELLRVPIIGFACWAMDCPIMRRYSKKVLEENPSLKGVAFVATRRACARYADMPVTVLNFAEGTRATAAKMAASQSPFRHMLRPKSGGFAYALQAMDEVLDQVLDVTIAYPGIHNPSLWDYCCGRIPQVYIQIRALDVPAHLRQGDYSADAELRRDFQDWLNRVWQDKDEQLDKMLRP